MKSLSQFAPALAALSLLFAVPAAQAVTAEAGDTIVVSGLGQVAAEPNMAIIEGAVVTEMKTVREAQQANAKIFNAAVDALKKRFNLGDSDLQTAGYTVQPVYDNRPNGQSVLRGYQVRHSLKIVIRDLSLLGTAVDLMAASGVNQLTLIRFSHSDKRTYELQALKLAMEDARMKADVIAQSAGRTVSRVKHVDFQSSEAPEAVVRGEALKEAASDVTEFIPGEIVIRAGVSVQFEF